jgi:hypothetical protein
MKRFLTLITLVVIVAVVLCLISTPLVHAARGGNGKSGVNDPAATSNPGPDNGKHDNGKNHAAPDSPGNKNDTDPRQDGNNGGCYDDNNGQDKGKCATPTKAPKDKPKPTPTVQPTPTPEYETGKLCCVPAKGSVCELFPAPDWHQFIVTHDAAELEKHMIAEGDAAFCVPLQPGDYAVFFWNHAKGGHAQWQSQATYVHVAAGSTRTVVELPTVVTVVRKAR